MVASTLAVGAKTGEIRNRIVEPVQAILDLSAENTLREEDAYHAKERNLILRKKQLADERAEIEASKSAEAAAALKATQVVRKRVVNNAPAQTQNAQTQQQQTPSAPSLPPMDPFPSDSYKESVAKSKADYEARVAEMNADYEANVAKMHADADARRAQNQADFDAFKAEHGM